MMSRPEWIAIEKPISVKLAIGELRICTYAIRGIICVPDIFNTQPLLSLYPPVEDMQVKGVKIARAYSYPLHENIKRISIKNCYLCYIDEQYKYYHIEINKNFQDYLSEKRKFIKDIRRNIRKIESINTCGKIFNIYSTSEEMDEFLSLAISISKKTYQHLLLNEGLPDTEEFRKNVIEKSEKGEVFGYILMINEKPVAYNICPVYDNNKVLYDYSGYDPEYKEYSVGTVLHLKVIEDLFNRKGLDFYDLCTGEGVHKKMFSTGYVLCGDIYYCHFFSRYALLIIIKIILKSITEKTKKILDFFDLKGKVKKKIREMTVSLKSGNA